MVTGAPNGDRTPTAAGADWIDLLDGAAPRRGRQPGDEDRDTHGDAHGHEGDGTGRSGRVRGWRFWFWSLVGWSLLVGVVLVIRLRAGIPGHPLVIAVVGLTPFLAAPLLGAAFAAWAGRSRALLAATVLTAGGFLVTVSPVDAVVGCRPVAADDLITVYTANVLFWEGRPDEIAASIAEADPDVVVLQEMRSEFTEALSADPLMAAYRFRSSAARGAPSSTAVWSRWPIAETQVERLDRVPIAHNIIDSPHGRFGVTGIHLTAPAIPGNVDPWQRELALLARYRTDTPRIMAGDFNATADHRPFRTVLDQGWTDVHEVKGCGFDATWPVGRGLPFPVLRLDHVLVTDDFEVLSVDFGDPGGSDHRPVIAELRLTDTDG